MNFPRYARGQLATSQERKKREVRIQWGSVEKSLIVTADVDECISKPDGYSSPRMW